MKCFANLSEWEAVIPRHITSSVIFQANGRTCSWCSIGRMLLDTRYSVSHSAVGKGFRGKQDLLVLKQYKYRQILMLHAENSENMLGVVSHSSCPSYAGG